MHDAPHGGQADAVELHDQAGRPWRLVDHRDAASLLVFLRGDW